MPPRLRLGLKIGILHVQVQHVPLLFLLICSNLFRCQIYIIYTRTRLCNNLYKPNIIFDYDYQFVCKCDAQYLYCCVFLCFIELGEEIQNG